ncbi:hypothetical protein ACFQX7_26905 [Luedemannella flava]
MIYIEGMPFMDYLVSKGYVTQGHARRRSTAPGPVRRRPRQGDPAGYASNEPYRWSTTSPRKKLVKSLLIHDSGTPSTRRVWPCGPTSSLANSACLKKLVPRSSRPRWTRRRT